MAENRVDHEPGTELDVQVHVPSGQFHLDVYTVHVTPPSARTTLTVPTFFNGLVVTRLHLRQVGGFNLGIPILTSIILPLMYLTLKFFSPIFSVFGVHYQASPEN